MTNKVGLELNTNEHFAKLKHAPIVEAVLEIRCRVENPWEEKTVQQLLLERLVGYEFLDSQHIFEHSFHAGLDVTPEQSFRDLGWKGVRFRSRDQKHVAHFNRDNFVFSRLEPYETWSQFTCEAEKLWQIYVDIGCPAEMLRIGVRFINRILLPGPSVTIEEYIQPHPDPPRGLDLPFAGYFQRDTLEVTGYPYGLNISRALQPGQDPEPSRPSIILDIDVFTTQPYPVSMETLRSKLSEMRWLKNKAFLGSISEQLHRKLRGVVE